MFFRRLMAVFCTMLCILYFSGLGWAQPRFLDSLTESTQAVHVHSLRGSTGVLDTWERSDGGWAKSMTDIPVVIGYNGAVEAQHKREGDGRTPKGLYRLGLAFGYQPLAAMKMPYKVLTEQDVWIDDPRSEAYNTLANAKPKTGSYETMRRADGLYRLGVVVEYNTRPVVAYKGSAIFLHVWRSSESVTEGCIAMAESSLRDLLLWLDQTKRPVIMIE